MASGPLTGERWQYGEGGNIWQIISVDKYSVSLKMVAQGDATGTKLGFMNENYPLTSFEASIWRRKSSSPDPNAGKIQCPLCEDYYETLVDYLCEECRYGG